MLNHAKEANVSLAPIRKDLRLVSSTDLALTLSSLVRFLQETIEEHLFDGSPRLSLLLEVGLQGSSLCILVPYPHSYHR